MTPNTKMETGPAKLEKFMASCEHGIWGFVIYRSAYGPYSDTDFSAFIQHLKELVAECDEINGKHPIFQKLTWTIFEDRNQLENLRHAQIKKMFDQWCCSGSAASGQPRSLHSIHHSTLARYQFCLHVNQDSLDSFNNAKSESPALSFERTAFVNIVARRFPQDILEEYVDEEEYDDEEEVEDTYPALEGNTDADVGWCKTPLDSIYPSSYVDLCRNENWFHFYVNPPDLVGSRHGVSYDSF